MMICAKKCQVISKSESDIRKTRLISWNYRAVRYFRISSNFWWKNEFFNFFLIFPRANNRKYAFYGRGKLESTRRFTVISPDSSRDLNDVAPRRAGGVFYIATSHRFSRRIRSLRRDAASLRAAYLVNVATSRRFAPKPSQRCDVAALRAVSRDVAPREQKICIWGGVFC